MVDIVSRGQGSGVCEIKDRFLFKGNEVHEIKGPVKGSPLGENTGKTGRGVQGGRQDRDSHFSIVVSWSCCESSSLLMFHRFKS